MPQQAATEELKDVREWGYCDRCHFLVPIVQVPYINAGYLEPHAAGKYLMMMVCNYPDRKPKFIPPGWQVPNIAKWDRIVADRIKRVNQMSPSDEDW